MNAIFRKQVFQAAVLLSLLAPLPAPGAASPEDKPAADTQEKQKKTDPPGFRFVFRDNPSFRFGKVLRIDVKARVQTDFRSFLPEMSTDEGVFDLHRARIGIEGKFLKYFEYEAEYDLKDQLRPLGEEPTISQGWRDVYVNFSYFNDIQVKAGKFKIPFCLDQLTGASKLDFIHRSRIGDILAPARDIGFQLHGRFFERGLSYQAGLFERDGENARSGRNPGAERTFAGRLTGAPLRLLPLPRAFKAAEFGFAFTSSTVPEGPKGLRGRTAAHGRFFPLPGDWMFVHGERLRLGTELSWTRGPFSLKGEFIHFRDQRLGQSLRQTDLPDLISRGWYLSGTWAVTGETKAPGIEPKRSFMRNWGIGAIELAARCEQIRFGSSEHPGAPLRHQRAANVLPTSDRAWTFGVNWYLNRWVKIQFNAVHEKIEDTMRGPIVGEDLLWTRALRLQVSM